MARPNSLHTAEATLLRALAHPIRLQILELLRTDEACVCHIQATLGQRQAYISQHLMALRDAGLVTSRKDGLRVYYRLSDPQLVAVLNDVQRVALARDGGDGQSIIERIPPSGRCNCPQCANN